MPFVKEPHVLGSPTGFGLRGATLPICCLILTGFNPLAVFAAQHHKQTKPSDGERNVATFQAKHVAHTGTISVDGEPDQVFALFEPANWVKWNPITRLHVQTEGPIRQGCVAMSQHNGAPPFIWLVSEYDAASRRIDLARIWSHAHVVRFIVKVSPGENGKSSVEITWDMTALSDFGNRAVKFETRERCLAHFKHWEKFLNVYLSTGELQKVEIRHHKTFRGP